MSSFDQLLNTISTIINADGRLGLFQYGAEKQVRRMANIIPFSLSQHISASKPYIS
jgi:hypothetical protein